MTASLPSPLFTVTEASEYLRLKPATLAKYRCIGGGPAFVKLGGRVLYRQDELDRWIIECTASSTSEYGTSAA